MVTFVLIECPVCRAIRGMDVVKGSVITLDDLLCENPFKRCTVARITEKERYMMKFNPHNSRCKKMSIMMREGELTRSMNLKGVVINQYKYKKEFLLTNERGLRKGLFGYFFSLVINGYITKIFISPDTTIFPEKKKFDSFIDDLIQIIQTNTEDLEEDEKND